LTAITLHHKRGERGRVRENIPPPDMRRGARRAA
jgi:hypothetical protein